MKEIYNQNTSNKFVNDCTNYSIHQIMNIKYGIKFKYTLIDKFTDYFIKIKVLLLGGAVFEDIYNAYCNKVFVDTGLKLKVSKVSITNKNFNEKDVYGIRLKKGCNKYIDSIKDGVLSNEDINILSLITNKVWQHNNIWINGQLIEIYTGKIIKCSLETLRYGIKMGVFGDLGRTFIGATLFDEKILNYVSQINFTPDEELIIKTKEDEKAVDIASKINYLYEIK